MKSNKVNKIDINPNKINEMVNETKPIKNGAYKAVIFYLVVVYILRERRQNLP